MVIVLWLIFVVLIGGYAESKNRSGLFWAIVAFFLSPLVAFLILAVLPKAEG